MHLPLILTHAPQNKYSRGCMCIAACDSFSHHATEKKQSGKHLEVGVAFLALRLLGSIFNGVWLFCCRLLRPLAAIPVQGDIEDAGGIAALADVWVEEGGGSVRLAALTLTRASVLWGT